MQISLFPSSDLHDTKTSWFTSILRSLDVSEGSGWPDRFGHSLHAWTTAHNPCPITALSLFSGGGGLDIGFHDAGFDIVEMVEVESRYAQTLTRNTLPDGTRFGGVVTCKDIREYHPGPDLNVDFVIGGPPCQTFSAAGRRASGVAGTSDPRGRLFQEYVRILEAVRPAGFLFENVYGITGAQDGKAWQDIQEAFAEVGYSIFFRILDAADYGVPQHRERLFIIGLRSGSYGFPHPTHGPDAYGRQAYFTAAEAIRGTDETAPSQKVGGAFGHLLDDIPPGLNYSFYTKEMGHPNPVFGWRSKFSDYLYKADPEAPVRTLKAQVGAYSGPFHWDNRTFTIPELKRLQTFPDSYEIVGNRQTCVEQIGNSVPPQIARLLALSVADQVFSRSLPFPMHYISEHKQLGFRKRKRLVSQSYAAKATAAHADAKDAPEGKSTSRPYKVIVRHLSQDFGWSENELRESTPLLLKKSIKSRDWTINVSPIVSANTLPVYTITVCPKNGMAWPLSQEYICLEAMEWSEAVFTGLWKGLQEEVKSLYGFADLVQLSGYYQYTQQFVSNITVNGSYPDDKWMCLQKVIEETSMPRLQTASGLAGKWSVPEDDVFGILLWLRTIGYEVRSHNTNPQIDEGNYLIPYCYPTLTPRSIQLRKKL